MTTEATTMTWQQVYDVIEARPVESLVQCKLDNRAGRNCVLAVLALHVGVPIDGGFVAAPVAAATGLPVVTLDQLMTRFDRGRTVAHGKERALAYIQEQIDGGE